MVRLREEVRPSVLSASMRLNSMHAVTCALYLVEPLCEDETLSDAIAEDFMALLAREAEKYGIVLW